MSDSAVIDPGTGHYFDISHEQYRAIPRLGSSAFKALSVSPGHYDYARRNPSPDTPETRIGTSLHLLAMEPARFSQVAVLSPHDEYRTNEAKAWRKEQEDMGLIPLKSKEWSHIHQLRDALMAHPAAEPLLSPGEGVHVESTVLFDYLGVRGKARPDVLRIGESATIIVDVKTTKCESEKEWDREVANAGLYWQPWWYTLGVELGADVRVDAFAWVVVSKEPPHAVWVRTASPLWIEAAQERGAPLLDTYKSCLASGLWPLSSPECVESVPPKWFMSKEIPS